MKRSIIMTIILLIGLTIIDANAQRRRQISPADTLRSIVTNSDGSTSFRIYAPEAKTVALGGDFAGYNAEFTKGSDGIWTAVVPKVSTDAYRYVFVVDGVKVIDPRYRLYSEITPIAHITNGEDIFWAQKDVPHGPVSQISYKSSTTGQTRSMHVWMPAGKASWKKLPVFYLIHGGGDNDASWLSIGCAGAILDNLYAEGKIEPMIVVMPHGGMDTRLFVDELVNDIMPRIEEQYQIKKGPANTALAGLSMGGHGGLWLGIRHQDTYGAAGSTSGGVDIRPFPKNWGMSLRLGTIEENPKNWDNYTVINIVDQLKPDSMKLIIDCGTEDFFYEVNCALHEKLAAAKIPHDFYTRPGVHNWDYWRNSIKYQILFFSNYFKSAQEAK
jgi:enterochelin esterase family protein